MFYTVTRDSRLFKPGTLYDRIDWTNLDAIADAFADRVSEWYVRPAEALKAVSGHFAFGAMALNCVLIDTLSQYYSGSDFSTGDHFKNFVRVSFPDFTVKLPNPDHSLQRKDEEDEINGGLCGRAVPRLSVWHRP